MSSTPVQGLNNWSILYSALIPAVGLSTCALSHASTASKWSRSLVHPSIDIGQSMIAFYTLWSLAYALLGVVCGRLWNAHGTGFEAGTRNTNIILFYFVYFFALLWTISYYACKDLVAACAVISFEIFLASILMASLWGSDRISFWLVLVYTIWLVINWWILLCLLIQNNVHIQPAYANSFMTKKRWWHRWT
jgi:tryptophan-rich sensory protein